MSGEPVNELNPFERAGLYVSLHAYLSWVAGGGGEPPVEVFSFFEALGIQLPREISRETADYVKNFRAGVSRTDLSPVARASLPHHLTAFYKSAGYLSTEPADSLSAMTAFAARLAMDAYTAHVRGEGDAEGLERKLYRFVNTHLMPALEYLKPEEPAAAEAVKALTELIKEDAETLKAKLSRKP